MSDTISVLTEQEVLDYLGIDYADTMVKNNIARVINTADAYLKGSIGVNYPKDDPRSKELALILVSDLYDKRGFINDSVSNNVRRLVDDLSLQLRLELVNSGYVPPVNPGGNTGDITVYYPYIDSSGYWYIWDNNQNQYVNSGVKAKGEKGEKGDKGEPGIKGSDGYTPQKGVDYFTDGDKSELVTAVLKALPNGDEVSY